MNVLADFIVRVEEQYPLSIENEELNSLLTTIRNQACEIETLNKEVASMRLNIQHLGDELAEENPSKVEKKEEKAPAKATAKKAKGTKKTAK